MFHYLDEVDTLDDVDIDDDVDTELEVDTLTRKKACSTFQFEENKGVFDLVLSDSLSQENKFP